MRSVLIAVGAFIVLNIATYILEKFLDSTFLRKVPNLIQIIVTRVKVSRSKRRASALPFLARAEPTDIGSLLRRTDVGFARKPLNDLQFQGMLETIYVLLRLDQLDASGGYSRSGVNTFYPLMGVPSEQITDIMRREGGITATCFILRGLRSFWLGSRIGGEEFFTRALGYLREHQLPDGGIGVKQLDRLAQKVTYATIRHTAQVLATLLEIAPDASRDIIAGCVKYVYRATNPGDPTAILQDSWPISAVVAYVRANDQLFRNLDYMRTLPVGSGFVHRTADWPGERETWIRFLAEIDKPGTREGGWHPEWSPVQGTPELWLHSLFTVLQQLPDLATDALTSDRVLAAIDRAVERLDGDRLVFAHTDCPDLSSTIALWNIMMLTEVQLLGANAGRNWDDVRTRMLTNLLSGYKEPSVLSHFWAEITAPVLQFAADPSLYRHDERRARLQCLESVVTALERGAIGDLPGDFSHLPSVIEQINANAVLRFGPPRPENG